MIRPPGSQSPIRPVNAERDRSSGPSGSEGCSESEGREERSRSVCCVSVSIGARCYPAPARTPEGAQLSRFSLIFAALPRSSRR